MEKFPFAESYLYQVECTVSKVILTSFLRLQYFVESFNAVEMPRFTFWLQQYPLKGVITAQDAAVS